MYSLLVLSPHVRGVRVPVELPLDASSKELELTDHFHRISIGEDGCMLSPRPPEIHDQLFGLVDVEGEAVLLAPECQ